MSLFRICLSFFAHVFAMNIAQAFDCPDKFKVFDERRGWICADGFGDARDQGFSTADEIHESPKVGSGRMGRGNFGFSENFENPNYQPVGIIGNDDRRPLSWEETRRAAVGVVGCKDNWFSGTVVYQGNLVVTSMHGFFHYGTRVEKCAGKRPLFQVIQINPLRRSLYEIVRLHAPDVTLISPKEGLEDSYTTDQSDILVAELGRPVTEFDPIYLPSNITQFMAKGEIHGVNYYGYYGDFKDHRARTAPGSLFFEGSVNAPVFFDGLPGLFATDIDSSPTGFTGSSGGSYQFIGGRQPIFLGVLVGGIRLVDGKPYEANGSPFNFNRGAALNSFIVNKLRSLRDTRLKQFEYKP